VLCSRLNPAHFHQSLLRIGHYDKGEVTLKRLYVKKLFNMVLFFQTFCYKENVLVWPDFRNVAIFVAVNTQNENTLTEFLTSLGRYLSPSNWKHSIKFRAAAILLLYILQKYLIKNCIFLKIEC